MGEVKVREMTMGTCVRVDGSDKRAVRSLLVLW